MLRTGEITEVQNGMLRISFCRQEACEKCGACDGNKKTMDLWIEGEGKVGNIALIDLPESAVVRASVLAYGFPLVLFIIGLILGGVFFPSGEAGTLIGGFIGLAVSCLIVALTEKKRKEKGHLNPTLVSVKEVNEHGYQSDIV